MTRLTPWTAMQPAEAERWGSDIFDPAVRARWCAAILLGGLPYIWRESARIPRAIAVDRLGLRPGARVLVLGEAISACGFDTELRAAVGSGEVVVVDFMERVRDLMMEGRFPQWDWSEYVAPFADGEFDAIAVFQGVAHAADWRATAGQLHRILKPGGSLAMAEVVFGRGFEERVRSDVHSEYFVEKLFEGAGFSFAAFPYWTPRELEDALSPGYRDIDSFAWRGVELTWARRDGMSS